MVLMSTWNGARYVAEQIESIRAQSVADWQFVVRDDGSHDDTVEIVRRFASLDPRIVMLEDAAGNLGPWASFGMLLSHASRSDAEYVFLSDQDDVWLPDKIERQLSLMKAAALRHGNDHPVLVHSDLVVVDADLQPIHESFSESLRMSYDAADPLRTLLIHNAITGCTIAMNRALLGAAVPVPPGSMHDWWLSLSAAAYGTILRAEPPTVRYRQHAANVVGAPPRHAFVKKLVRNPFEYIVSAYGEFGIGVQQALRLRDRMRAAIPGNPQRLERVESYCSAFADDTSLIARLRALRESKARPQRALSRVILCAIAASYPAMRRVVARSASAEAH
jgi:glycosyltransferase involved in cell wall biosynthesis